MQALVYAREGETIEVGRCERVRESAQGRTLDVHVLSQTGGDTRILTDCIDQVEVQAGDRVLMLTIPASERPVVIGTIGAGRGATVRLTSGYRADSLGSCLRLADPSGRVVLEIETSGGAPRVKPVGSDLTLDMEGRLRLEARSIELRAKLGDITVEANDDFVARGERIRLN